MKRIMVIVLACVTFSGCRSLPRTCNKMVARGQYETFEECMDSERARRQQLGRGMQDAGRQMQGNSEQMTDCVRQWDGSYNCKKRW